jgi:hypothetical protein
MPIGTGDKKGILLKLRIMPNKIHSSFKLVAITKEIAARNRGSAARYF